MYALEFKDSQQFYTVMNAINVENKHLSVDAYDAIFNACDDIKSVAQSGRFYHLLNMFHEGSLKEFMYYYIDRNGLLKLAKNTIKDNNILSNIDEMERSELIDEILNSTTDDNIINIIMDLDLAGYTTTKLLSIGKNKVVYNLM